MNKNSNIYQILYAAVMVVLVGVVLAFVYMTLKPQQDENISNDKRRQILAALHVAVPNENQTKETYEKHIVADLLIDMQGNIVDSTANHAFAVDMKKNVKLPDDQRQLPLFKAVAADGATKYVIPVYGAGLWGPIWGFIAINDDGKTIYGANFSHEGETPGLGARITEQGFQAEFEGKSFYPDSTTHQFVSVEVLKKGQKSLDGAETVDAISGATITSRGVSDMISACVKEYSPFLLKLQAGN